MQRRKANRPSHTSPIGQTMSASMKSLMCVAMLCLLIAAQLSRADVMTIQGADDTWLNQDEYAKNYGGDTSLHVRRDVDPTEDDDRTSLVRFNLSSIPENAVINSAKLSLYYYDEWYMTSSDYLDVSVFPLKASWDEGVGGSGGDIRSGASWQYRYALPNNATWQVNGARGSNDRAAADAVVTLDDTVGRWVDWQSANLTQTVAKWYVGTLTNNGWAMDYTRASDDEDGVIFWSGEEDSWGPKLTVEYTIIPEPVTLSLIAIGGVALLRRRR